MRQLFVIIILLTMGFGGAQTSHSIALDSTSMSWWLYNTGNETQQDFELYETPLNETLNVSLSYVWDLINGTYGDMYVVYNGNTTWGYGASGFLAFRRTTYVGIRNFTDYDIVQYTNYSWLFSRIDNVTTTGRMDVILDSIGYFYYADGSTSWVRLKVWRWMLLQISSAQSTMTVANKTVSGYRVNAISLPSTVGGYQVSYNATHIYRTEYINGSQQIVTIDRGNVIQNYTIPFTSYWNYTSMYSPQIGRVVYAELRSQTLDSTGVQVDNAGPNILSKQLLDFYVPSFTESTSEISSTKTSSTVGENATVAKSPVLGMSMLLAVVVWRRCRKKH